MSFVFSRVRTELSGTSRAGVRQMMYEVWSEFWDATNAWQNNIPLNLKEGVTDYPIQPLDPGQIIRLLGVLDSNLINQVCMMPVIGTVTLRDPPTNTTPPVEMKALVALNVLPVDDDNVPFVPIWAEPLWGLIIYDGVVGRFCNQQGRPYSNDQKAVYHLKRYRDGLARAKTAVLRRNTFGVNAWQYPQSFRTRGQKGGVSVGGNQNVF